MPFDYTEIAATAVELVADSGRTITFQQLDGTPAASDFPWEGATNPQTVVSSLALPAAFVDPESAAKLGATRAQADFVKRGGQVAMVATSQDLHRFTQVTDSDGSRWRVDHYEELKPGDTRLLYFVWLTR